MYSITSRIYVQHQTLNHIGFERIILQMTFVCFWFGNIIVISLAMLLQFWFLLYQRKGIYGNNDIVLHTFDFFIYIKIYTKCFQNIKLVATEAKMSHEKSNSIVGLFLFTVIFIFFSGMAGIVRFVADWSKVMLDFDENVDWMLSIEVRFRRLTSEGLSQRSSDHWSAW